MTNPMFSKSINFDLRDKKDRAFQSIKNNPITFQSLELAKAHAVSRLETLVSNVNKHNINHPEDHRKINQFDFRFGIASINMTSLEDLPMNLRKNQIVMVQDFEFNISTSTFEEYSRWTDETFKEK